MIGLLWIAVETAAATTAGTAVAEKKVLFVPVAVEGARALQAHLQPEIDARVGAVLKEKRMEVQRTSHPTELNCRTANCLEQAALKHGADVVLGARVAVEGTPPSYRLSVWRYDLVEVGTQRRAETECLACTESQLLSRVTVLVEKIFDPRDPSIETIALTWEEPGGVTRSTSRPDSVQTQTAGSSLAVAAPAEPPLSVPIFDVAAVDRHPSRRSRVAMQVVGLGLVGAGLGGLAWGVVEARHNGDQIVRNGQIGTLDTTVGRDALLSAGALAFAAGGALALVGWLLPERRGGIRVEPIASARAGGLRLEWTR
jgi:hypothetical protein